MRKKAKSLEVGPKATRGAFLSNGSWLEDARERHRGHVHALVKALVQSRRMGALSIDHAVNAIEAASATLAFPNFEQWRQAESWRHVCCSSSAEAFVKHEGRGASGHWCGERCAAGSESECEDRERHRPTACPDESKRALNAMWSHMEAAKSVNIRGLDLTMVREAAPDIGPAAEE